MQRRLLGIPGLKLLCLCLAFPYYSCLPDGDLCKWMNGRKYYIDVGESGLISAENVTSQSKLGEPQIPQRCSVELITCPSCHFEIHLRRLAIPTCAADSTCRCDFLWIKEAAFTKSGQEYCGFKRNDSAVLIYESKTKLVSVDFLYSGSYTDAFALQFSAKKNVYVHKGGYEYYQSNNTGLIRSPNFPGGYPSDYSAEYILQNIDTTGFVQLLFTDFQLSLWSYLEILDSNGSRIDVYNGNTFRPPAVISSGPTMTVKFQANDEYPSSGFKAKFTFVSYPEKYWINRPSTDCGGFVEDNGGGITMMNMVPSNSLRAFDCIWLIRPRNSHIPETQISVRVAQFEEMGPKSTLTIHEGLHSEAPLLESVTTFQHHKMPRGQEYVVPATHGFYIRLVGHFNNKSHLAIIYTTFRYDGCYAVGDFECENGRCIKNALRCDGFNHCGDGSDEASCYGANQGTPSPDDANWWRTLTPNYYFPKPDGNSSAGTNTLILVTSLAGLGMFVLTTVVILVKLHKQRQDDSISREILPTVSADVDSESSPNHHGTSDPPLYDPPPSYEDVIKFYLPPPPAYNSISSQTQHPSQAAVTGGTDNVGFRSDSPVAIRGRGRRTRVKLHRWVMQEAPQPMILRVSLPSEVRPVPVATSTKNTCCDMNGVVLQGNTNLPIPEVVLKNTKPRSSGQELIEEHSHCENISSGVQCTANNVKLSHTSSRCKSSLQSDFCAVKPLPSDAEHICNDTERTNSVLTTTKALSCECQGACTCTLQDETLAEVTGGSKRCQQRNSAATKEGQFCRKKESITESTSDQQSIVGSSGSGIIAHPTPMIITVSPFRYLHSVKKIPNEMGSKSEGPSSPTTLFANQSKNFGDSNGEKFSSLSRLGHRRSSSGPLEKLCSQDLTMNVQPKIINSPCNRFEQCEPNVNFFQESSNLSQVKHLASTLLGGLHQTLNFQNNGCERTIDSSAESLNKAAEKKDKNILPVTWSTSLWNPVRRRPERCESYKFEGGKYSWPPSDTQPLLKKVASQPQLGNRSVNKKNDSLGETEITNNII